MNLSAAKGYKLKKIALLYEKLDHKSVRCSLCAHRCKIAQEQFGFCGVRQNLGGALFTYAYGEVIAAHVDPIEKKPLYQFFPGSQSYSIATIGCNFRCGFCQNWQISQQSFRDHSGLRGETLSAQDVVDAACKFKCKSIAYTYTEPTIFFEYALEIMRLAKTKGLYNIFVTNGYMTKECLEMAQPYLDAANIDLKFFNDDSYKRVCAGGLQPVLDTIELMYKYKIWIEITTLLIDGENDSNEELSGISRFIAGIDKNIPWHISRFHPDYKFSEKRATLEASIKKALDIARSSGLNYVYAGNVYNFGNDTYCPACKKAVIKRAGFDILEGNLKNNKCIYCNEAISGKFN